MGITNVSTECGAETYRFLCDVVDFIAAVKKAAGDGWDYSSDVPAVVQAALKELGPYISSFGPVLDELAKDKEAAGKSLALAALYAYDKLKG